MLRNICYAYRDPLSTKDLEHSSTRRTRARRCSSPSTAYSYWLSAAASPCQRASDNWIKGSALANALTISRIILSVALLALPALSPIFLAVYALAGTTDMLDGLLARRAGTVSELGAKLDSIADLVLVVVCLMKILPAIDVPMWLWVWVAQ